MTNTSSAYQYSEVQSTFFVEKLIGQADLVYRLAYAYTFDRSASFAIVKQVFDQLVGDVPRLMVQNTEQIRFHIMGIAWDKVKPVIGKSKATGKDYEKFLATIPESHRAILLMVEAFGLTVEEIAEIHHYDVVKTSKLLAEARKLMIANLI